MSDFNSSLPIRTEQDGDVVIKVGDGLVPSQHLKVNVDGSVNITDNGASLTVDATDLDIRDLAFASDKVDASGSVVALDAATLAALESIAVSATDLDVRDLSHAQDSIKIGDGTDFLAINADGSINVVAQEDVGVETTDFNAGVAVAAGASSIHDLLFATSSKFYQVLASASGLMKVEVQVETGSATGIFTTLGVQFNSTANPNINFQITKYAVVPAGARIRVIRTNRDKAAMDVYSTINGVLGL